MGKRILITRLGWFLGYSLAQQLERLDDVEYVLGLDSIEPPVTFGRTEFLKADMRKPVFAKILEATGIDTVIHLGLWSTPSEAGGRGAMHDLNVIGAMQLFAACQRSSAVKQVIIRSSTAVYGSGSDDPAVFTEDMMRSERADPFGRDCQEMEAYARDLSRRRPDVSMTTFRFANILGPAADTPLANYLTMPIVPTALGFDPRLQFIHSEDATDLMVQAVQDPVEGIFNASADGVMYLSQVIRQGGRIPLGLPRPTLKLLAPALRMIGSASTIPPHVSRLINWGRVADNERMRRVFKFTPRYSTADAVREFYADRRLRRIAARDSRVHGWEREMNAFIAKKGRERFKSRLRPETDSD